MGLSRVPEYRCGAAAARDLTGWEHIDGAALGKGGNRRQLQYTSQPVVLVADRDVIRCGARAGRVLGDEQGLDTAVLGGPDDVLGILRGQAGLASRP